MQSSGTPLAPPAMKKDSPRVNYILIRLDEILKQNLAFPNALKKSSILYKVGGWCVVQLSREGNELQVLQTPEQTLSAWQQKQITDKSVPILFSLFFSAKMRETTEISQKVKAVEPPGTWAGSGLPSIQCNSRCCPLISKPLFCVRSSNLSDVSLRLKVSAWDQAGLLANGPQVWVSSGWGFQEIGDWGWDRGLWQAAQIFGMCLLCLPGGLAVWHQVPLPVNARGQ